MDDDTYWGVEDSADSKLGDLRMWRDWERQLAGAKLRTHPARMMFEARQMHAEDPVRFYAIVAVAGLISVLILIHVL